MRLPSQAHLLPDHTHRQWDLKVEESDGKDWSQTTNQFQLLEVGEGYHVDDFAIHVWLYDVSIIGDVVE